MILVFILLGILILISFVTILIILSTIHIEVKNLEISNIKRKGKSKSEYAVSICLYLGNKIRWLWFNLNDEKMKKMYSNIQLEKIDLKKGVKFLKYENLKEIKRLKIEFSEFNLEAIIGFANPIITSFTVAGIASIIPIFLAYFSKIYGNGNKKYRYIVKPIYENKNLYKIKLNCIIEIKTVHIINMLYIFLKKGRSERNEQSTSNRKSYDYSYE